MIEVSVIIINYNTPEITSQCINSVIKHTEDINIEIILVDNASTDNSYELFKTMDNIKYIYNKENVGFGKGNNIGVRSAKGRYLFFLNSDTILINNAIKILHNFISKKPDVGSCGANLYNRDLEPTHSYSIFFPSILNEILFLIPRLPRIIYGKSWQFNYSNENIEVAYNCGAALMISKDLFNNLGGYNKDFFMYYEETELSYRIRKNNYYNFSVPEAHIIHLEGISNKTSELKLSTYLTSRFTYFLSVYGLRYMKYSYVSFQIINIFLLIKNIILFNNNKYSKYKYYLIKTKQIYQSVKQKTKQ